MSKYKKAIKIFKKFNQNDVLVSEQSLYGMVNKKTLILLIILLQCYLCSNMVNIW